MQVKVILPMYNVEKWIATTYESLRSQSFTEYTAYFLDDCSSDRTVEKLRDLSSEDNRVQIISNLERRYSMGNLWINLDGIVEDEDLVVIIDGDDWFFDENVLSKIVNKFQEGYEFIHGQFLEYPKMVIVDERGYSDEVIRNNSFRTDRWRCSGIRAFKGALWRKIDKNQVMDGDSFYEFTADQAYTYPLLENSKGKIYRFEEPIHVYNRMNPINDDKVSRQRQIQAELKIRNISLEGLLDIMKNDNLKIRRLV